MLVRHHRIPLGKSTWPSNEPSCQGPPPPAPSRDRSCLGGPIEAAGLSIGFSWACHGIMWGLHGFSWIYGFWMGSSMEWYPTQNREIVIELHNSSVCEHHEVIGCDIPIMSIDKCHMLNLKSNYRAQFQRKIDELVHSSCKISLQPPMAVGLKPSNSIHQGLLLIYEFYDICWYTVCIT